MIIWRIDTAYSDTPATLFRAVYPGFCLWRAAEMNSTFACGNPNRRILGYGEIGQTNALILSSNFSKGDVELARQAAGAGWRVVLDQLVDPSEPMRDGRAQPARDYRILLPVVHAITFANRSVRNECVANGFPAEKCHITPVPDLSQTEVDKAMDWAHSRIMRFGPYPIIPVRKGWQADSRDDADRHLHYNSGLKIELSGERECALAWQFAFKDAPATALAL